MYFYLIDDRYSIQLHNKCDSLYNLNVFEEQSRKVSPERNPIFREDDNELTSPTLKEQDSAIPNTRDQFATLTAYNSPIRGSYSAMKQKQQSYNI